MQGVAHHRLREDASRGGRQPVEDDAAIADVPYDPAAARLFEHSCHIAYLCTMFFDERVFLDAILEHQVDLRFMRLVPSILAVVLESSILESSFS